MLRKSMENDELSNSFSTKNTSMISSNPTIHTKNNNHENTNRKTKFILALDVGSSSIRCSAYEQQIQQQQQQQRRPSEADKSVENSKVVERKQQEDDNVGGGSSCGLEEGCCWSSRSIAAVMPNSGNISNVSLVLDEIDRCIDDTLALLRQKYNNYQIVGMGISSFVMNFIAVNHKLEPIIGDWASMSYACNSPSVAKECQTLRRELGKEKVEEMYQRTGAPIHSAYALPQLRDLYQRNSSEVKNIYGWQTIASLCLSRWIGCQDQLLPISYSEASWTGLLNFRTCQWDSQTLNLLPLSCQQALPPLTDYNHNNDNNNNHTTILTNGIPPYITTSPRPNNNHDDPSKKVKWTNPYWERWPELRGNYNTTQENIDNNNNFCRLFLGIGDGACANIGSKCSTPFRIAVTIGTSAAARICLPLPITTTTTSSPSDKSREFHVPPGLFCYRIDKAHVLLGGALTDGGSVIEWARNLLSLSNNDDLEFQNCIHRCQQLYEQQIIITANPRSDDGSVIFIPFLSGERSTGYRDNAKGCLLGLTRTSSPDIVLKACMEGVILRIQAILTLILQQQQQQQQLEPMNIIASGNALEKNSLWRQMLSDCSSLKVLIDSDCKEGTSKGAATLVHKALITQQQSFVKMPCESIRIQESKSPRKTLFWKHIQQAQTNAIESISSLW